MCKFIPAALLGLVVLGTPVLAQEDYRANEVSLVRSFYRQYLHRDPDPEGLRGFVDYLRNGGSPDLALAQILASNEYYSQAGGTDADYIRSLFRDLGRREPGRAELREWLGRMNGETNAEIATDLIRRFRRFR